MRKLLTAIIGTATAAYFLDPDEGRRRRHVARDRAMGLLRTGARKGERAARAGSSFAEGKVEQLRAVATPSEPPADDHALADRVRTELFRPADSPKGHVNVDVVDGVVSLRGEVKTPADVKGFEAQVRAIPGVRDVENLLHTPGTVPQNVQAVRGTAQ